MAAETFSCNMPALAALLLIAALCAGFACGEEYSESSKKGFEALQLSQTDPHAIVAAARYFTQAADEYEKAGKMELSVEMSSYLYWCKKKMTLDDINAFLKGGESNTVKRLETAAKEVDQSNAKQWFDRATEFAQKSPDKHLLIAIRFFEVADRFKGTDIGLSAQERSLAEMQKFIEVTPSGGPVAPIAPVAAPKKELIRVPVPNAAALKDAEKLILEIYADEFAKTKPENGGALINKLMDQAAQNKDDPAARYVLLRKSIALAGKIPDLIRVLTLLDKLGEQFQTDMAALKKAALADVAPGKDPELTKALAAARALQDNPDNPAQNLAFGRYAVSKDEWDLALPYLAKGSDSAIQKLAQQELAGLADAPAKAALGDGWWDLGESETGKGLKKHFAQHATAWYKQALPALSGLAKAKVEKRISVSTEIDAPEPSKTAKTDAKPAAKPDPQAELAETQLEIANGVIKSGAIKSNKHLPAGTYRGAGLLSWPDVDTTRSYTLTIEPGTELTNVSFSLNQLGWLVAKGTLEKPIVFHNCAIMGDFNTYVDAAFAIFDKCKFEKVGTHASTSLYNTKWWCKNCIFDNHVFPHLGNKQYGYRFDDCAFNNVIFPPITWSAKDKNFDHVTIIRQSQTHIEGCTFMECTIPPFFLWTITKSNYYNCRFMPGDVYDSDTELVIDSYFLQPIGKPPDQAKRKPVTFAPAKTPFPAPQLPKTSLPDLQSKLKLLYPDEGKK